jgi:enoyl-[acyl-carrier protein] reductase II
MLRTPVCDLLGMEVPIMQAAIWPATSPKLVAAVSEAGGLGSIGSVFESAQSIQRQIARVREITARPFAVNHVVPLLDEAAFRATLEAKPEVVSFALGYPGDLVERAHDAGAKVIHQIHTVGQARRAAELGVDVIIAQGSEAGGQGMALGVGAMALIPQVADAVDPIPVLAAGGVADGRGLAAALVLGAQGANVGTRFLASEEASAEEGWKRTILQTESEDVVRFEAWEGIFPPAGVAPTRRRRACCVHPSSRSGWDAPKRRGGKRSGCGMKCSRRSGSAPPTSCCPSPGRRQVWSTTSCRLER